MNDKQKKIYDTLKGSEYTCLKEYLEQKGVLDTFCRNFERSKFHAFEHLPLDYLQRYILGNDCYLITDAFDWTNTPEGYNFWHELSLEWYKSRKRGFYE